MAPTSARSLGSTLPAPSAPRRAAPTDRVRSIPASSATQARDPPHCAPAAAAPRPAVHPGPASSPRIPLAAPGDRADARSALRTAPPAPFPELHPRTPGPLRSPCRTTLRGPSPASATTAVPSQLSFHPCSWHSSSWRLPPLTQPDLPIGRGLPPLKSQQPSGHRPYCRTHQARR